MRNALIVLAVVALAILAAGALNTGVVFNVDYVAGTVRQVSLFWVSAILAALVVVAGLGASWFARAAVGGTRRKLEAELQSTYERLRETESARDKALAVAEAAQAAARAAEAAAAPAPEETVIAEPEAATVVAAEAVTLVQGEAVTVAQSAAEEGPVSETPPADAGDAPPVGETTAVTMAGIPLSSQDADAQEEPAAALDAAPAAAADRPSRDAEDVTSPD